MAKLEESLSQDRIVVGQPLPFSVYSADRKLLLAKGEMVESDRIRDSLLRVGRYQSNSVSLVLPAGPVAANAKTADNQADTAAEPAPPNPLETYSRDQQTAGGLARVGIRVSRDEEGESFPCWILGADEQHGLIVTAPAKGERSFVAVTEGQSWVFRTMYLTAAVKFHGVIRKVQFDPVPSLNVSLPTHVELRHVRASPRVNACLQGHIDVGKELPVLITDISTGGVRVALDRAQGELAMGQRLSLNFAISMLGQHYTFKLPATVISRRGEFEKRYPQLLFAGLKIESQSELERLVLHSYVYERMMLEFNPLWRLLMHQQN